MFLSPPKQHILKKVQKVLPSFISNAFSVLFFDSFMGYLLKCPCPIQSQFCQIHFRVSVFTICFPILFFFLAHFNYCFQFNFFLCLINLKRTQELYISFYEAIPHSYQDNAYFFQILVLQPALY